MDKKLKFRAWDKIGARFYSQNIINRLPVDVFFSGELLQQYTGLVDARGNEIYEGDILQSINSNIRYEVKKGWYRQSEQLEMKNGQIYTVTSHHVGFFVEYKENNEVFEMTLAVTNSNSVVVGHIFDTKS